MDTPPAEAEIDEELIARLVASQHPRPRRTGADRGERLGQHRGTPRARPGSADSAKGGRGPAHPQRGALAARARGAGADSRPGQGGPTGRGLPMAVADRAVATGHPARHVCRGSLASSGGRARRAAHRALHALALEGAPHNPVCGVPLADRSELVPCGADGGRRTRGSSGRSGARPWQPPVTTRRRAGCTATRIGQPARGYAGALAAILDFGDITAGDPASDRAWRGSRSIATGSEGRLSRPRPRRSPVGSRTAWAAPSRPSSCSIHDEQPTDARSAITRSASCRGVVSPRWPSERHRSSARPGVPRPRRPRRARPPRLNWESSDEAAISCWPTTRASSRRIFSSNGRSRWSGP